jgi:transcriptional regulator with XRE-family HTH domain
VTPFGSKLRALRAARGLSAKDMADGLGVSPAYLQYLGIIWDEAEALQRLADLSHPRVTLDTAGLSPQATELANRLAEQIHDLPPQTVERMLAALDEALGA